MKIYLLNILFIVANINFIFAQQGKISGTVYDENGETIPGVMIFVGDNKFGKQTDIDG